jgi:hypothetical protein
MTLKQPLMLPHGEVAKAVRQSQEHGGGGATGCAPASTAPDCNDTGE